MLALNSLLQRLGQLTPWQFEGELRETWGAENPQNRQHLRAELAQRYTFTSDILDMATLPLPTTGSLSISHSLRAGGFIFSPHRPVGFDIEEKSRVTFELCRRISAPYEIDPSWPSALVWVAKEAGFKAAVALNPQVLREIELLSLSEIETDIYRFKCQLRNQNQLIDGLASTQDEFHAIAIAWLKGSP